MASNDCQQQCPNIDFVVMEPLARTCDVNELMCRQEYRQLDGVMGALGELDIRRCSDFGPTNITPEHFDLIHKMKQAARSCLRQLESYEMMLGHYADSSRLLAECRELAEQTEAANEAAVKSAHERKVEDIHHPLWQ